VNLLDPEPPGAEETDHFDYDPNNPVPSIGGNSSIGHWAGSGDDPVISARSTSDRSSGARMFWSTPVGRWRRTWS
jgi:hypothetical protein